MSWFMDRSSAAYSSVFLNLTFSTSFFSVISAVKIFHLQANPWKKYVLALFYIKKILSITYLINIFCWCFLSLVNYFNGNVFNLDMNLYQNIFDSDMTLP